MKERMKYEAPEVEVVELDYTHSIAESNGVGLQEEIWGG